MRKKATVAIEQVKEMSSPDRDILELITYDSKRDPHLNEKPLFWEARV